MNPTRTLLTVSAVLAMVPAAGVRADGPVATLSIRSPLVVTDSPRPDFATAVTLDNAVYDRLGRSRQVVVGGFPLDETTRVGLALERFDVFAPDARIVRAAATGEQPMPRPDVVLLRGTIVGQPESTVFLALSPHGTNGVISSALGRHIISSGPRDAGMGTVIYNAEAV
ncbi:MAG: hypothetical protein ACYSU7_04495, partial [Planctomycetota bacterium]